MKITVVFLSLIFFSFPALAADKKVSIKCVIGTGKNAIVFPLAVTRFHREVALRHLRELTYPTEWAIPKPPPELKQLSRSQTQNVISVRTPTSFVTQDVGWTIRCTARTEDKLIHLLGIALFSEPDNIQAAYGEKTGPIYSPQGKMLLKNKMSTVSIVSSETPFQIFALPGKEYQFKLRRLTPMKITAVILALTLLTPSAFAGSKTFTIRCTIGQGRDAITLPAATAPQHREALFNATTEYRYADKWNLPFYETRYGETLLMPVTPTSFFRVENGWILRCSAEILGNYIRLNGTALFTKSELVKAVYGELSGPLHASWTKYEMTANVAKTGSSLTSETPFQIFALPGKEYEIKIRQLNKWIPCGITCDYAN